MVKGITLTEVLVIVVIVVILGVLLVPPRVVI